MFGTDFSLKAAVAALGLLLLASLAGCSATYQNHGYVPPEEALQQLVAGVDTRATVDDKIGTPTAMGMLSGGDYYYVRSRVRTFGMRRPEVVDRQVLAISFDDRDVIKNIERFGLKDGKAVTLSRRVTTSSVEGNGFLKQMLSNFGRLNPADFF